MQLPACHLKPCTELLLAWLSRWQAAYRFTAPRRGLLPGWRGRCCPAGQRCNTTGGQRPLEDDSGSIAHLTGLTKGCGPHREGGAWGGGRALRPNLSLPRSSESTSARLVGSSNFTWPLTAAGASDGLLGALKVGFAGALSCKPL